jgi:hypothetical protein
MIRPIAGERQKSCLPPIIRFIQHWKPWARRAGTFPFERVRIGRHWNCPLRHRPYRKGAVPPVGRQATAAIRIR